MFECIGKRFYEIYVILRIASEIFTQLGFHFMIQDKICLNQYNQTEEFCQKINKIQDNHTDAKIRDRILADAAIYTQYYSLVDFVPMFIWILFIGSFLDKNKNATKWILYLHLIADSLLCGVYLVNEFFFHLDTFWCLPAALTTALSGGMATFMTVSYRFLGITSLKKDRPIRLMMCQFALAAGSAVGAMGGGYLLHSNNLDGSHFEIRTYYINFGASILVNIICIPLLLSALKRGDKMMVLVKEEEKELEIQEIGNVENGIAENVKESDKEPEAQFKKGFFYDLFDVENIKSTWRCLRQPRPNRINFSIYSIYVGYFLVYFSFIGTDSVSLQFCQKVYNWNAKQYGTVSAINRIVFTLVVAVSVIIFVKKYMVDDSKLVTISTSISSAAFIVVGLFLKDIVYIVAMPFMGIAGLAFVCLRNKLAAMVKTEELGRMFSMVELIMSFIPLLSAIVYSNLFAAVVSTYPGMVYQFSGLLYLFALLTSLFEQYWCNRGFWSHRFVDDTLC